MLVRMKHAWQIGHPTGHSTKKANKSSGNNKQNPEESAAIFEKDERRASFLQAYKSGDATLTACQGKVNQHVLIFTTRHNDNIL